MGLKRGKYAYVELSPGRYVKVRVIKSRAEDSPRRYVPVSGVTSYVPPTAMVVKLDSIPEQARRALLEALAA